MYLTSPKTNMDTQNDGFPFAEESAEHLTLDVWYVVLW